MTESAGMADVLGFLVWITVIPVLVALAMRSRRDHGEHKDVGTTDDKASPAKEPRDGEGSATH